jgi:RNA recognition motif-containing protein
MNTIPHPIRVDSEDCILIIPSSYHQRVTELKKLFIGNLPTSTTVKDLEELFSEFGTVRSSNLVTDVFSGQCKGFGFIEMEGHEARAAIAGLDGKDFKGNSLRVNFESPKAGRRGR